MQLLTWLTEGRRLSCPSVVWFEFLNGPVDRHSIHLMRETLAGRILPLTDSIAEEAPRLWNAEGRIRSLRIDSPIAATAMVENHTLATRHLPDFRRFVPYGLKLVDNPPP